jgi:hypothetical protein
MSAKASDTRTRITLAVDVVELLGGWMEQNGHTSPTAATNAALRQFLKGVPSNPVVAAHIQQPEPHTTVRKLQVIPQSSEPESLLHSAFSDLLSE